MQTDTIHRPVSFPVGVAVVAARSRIVCGKHRFIASFRADDRPPTIHVHGSIEACCNDAADLFLLTVRTQAIRARQAPEPGPMRSLVLFLDESPVFLMVGEMICRRRGIRSANTPSVQECIAALRTKSIGALVVSLMLSRGSGFEVIDWLRENAPDMLQRTVALTEAASPLGSSLQLPVREIFERPLDFRRLVTVLENCIAEAETGPDSIEAEMNIQEA